MDAAKAAEFVESYLDAWNRQDSLAVARHLAKNGIYLDMPVHQNMTREELIVHLDELFEEENYIYELAGEVLAGKHTVAYQYRALPRKATETPLLAEAWFGAEFITLRDGAALEIADYYDPEDAQPPGSPLAGATRSTRVQRYAKSGLSAQNLAAVKRQLGELMEREKLYLRPDLTLPELSEALDCTVNHVSQAINAGFGMSFFDFLNEYRVQDAMALLSDSDGEERTVLSVALEVGFNSTSTFYVAFKKVSGMTPAQFRRKNSGQSG